ncbi:MAG TPA: hypothetical protein VHP35_11675 [Terriglobia bacterium]|nr:hypothetical protein [Terriglobia bacterium]
MTTIPFDGLIMKLNRYRLSSTLVAALGAFMLVRIRHRCDHWLFA